MKLLLALTISIAVVATACAPANQGGSFAALPGKGSDSASQRGRGSSYEAQRPAVAPESVAPADDELGRPPGLKPSEVFPSHPAYGDEDPGDFFIKPKHQAIHI